MQNHTVKKITGFMGKLGYGTILKNLSVTLKNIINVKCLANKDCNLLDTLYCKIYYSLVEKPDMNGCDAHLIVN